MKLKKVILFSVISLLSVNLSAQRISKLINTDWVFTYGYDVKKSAKERVDIPHTWNATDALTGQLDYYRGVGNYQKEVFIEEEWKGKRLFLKFDGVNTVANVFVNGKHIGEHRGGYTAFIFELTDKVEYGQNNTILVRANNALQLDVMPLLGDFNFYGGVYRDVHLIVSDEAIISPLDYASSGIYLKQNNVSKEKAEVEALVKISNPKQVSSLSLYLNIFDGESIVFQHKLSVAANATEIQVPIVIEKPHLWNGVKDPFMYRVELTLTDGKDVHDTVEQNLGLRFYTMDSNDGFFLNGEHLKLHGVCRHQDRAIYANALRPEHHDEDLALIEEMGANTIRLSHYPQAPYFYDLLDKSGIVAWSEIPFIGPGGYKDKGFVNQASFRANGKQQLIEMIRQNYNHPSICFWGLFNELKTNGDNPVDYIKELNALAHNEDPTRITTSASNIEDKSLNSITDLIAWNRYFGWYRGNPSDLGPWMDNMHSANPEFRIGLSEYGAGASVFHHQEEFKKPIASSRFHPENWQRHYHEEYWKVVDQRDYIWGTYIWNMFDFGAVHRREGEAIGINDKGLVSFDRKVKKDVFFFYKANWNTQDKFVHLNDKRFTIREQVDVLVSVYSNCEEVELFVNGVSQGKHTGDYGTFIWNDITLQIGDNKIEVRSKHKKEVFIDTCMWTRQ